MYIHDTVIDICMYDFTFYFLLILQSTQLLTLNCFLEKSCESTISPLF